MTPLEDAPARTGGLPGSGASTGRRSRRWRVALASVSVTLFLLAAAEAGLRVLRPLPPLAPLTLIGLDPRECSGRFVEDPDTGYALAPGHREAEHHAGAYATSDWPYRNAPPRAGVPGVALLGDSCVYGVGVRPSETMAARTADELARRGRGPDQVQVLNLGVPGFTTAQTLVQLRTLLRHDAPRIAIFYLGAWNDQAPAMIRPDAEVLASRRGVLAWIRSTALSRLLVPAPACDPVAVNAAFDEHGLRLHGPRVTLDELTSNVEEMLELCRAANVQALVMLPAWPAPTRERRERLASDRERVRAVAERAGVPCLDARQALDAAGLGDGAAFVDFVHPSPAAHAVLGAELARAVAERLPPASSIGGLTLRSIEPRSACALGDSQLVVEVDGLEPGEVPLVIAAHAPLLGLRALGDGRYTGTLMANAGGLHDVLVAAGTRCAYRRGALELWEPGVELDRAHGRLVLRARPGDRGLVMAFSRLASPPGIGPKGPVFLDSAHVVASFPDLTIGDDGLAPLPVDPTTLDTSGGLWLQALVLPAGTEVGLAGRFSGVLDLGAALEEEPWR